MMLRAARDHLADCLSTLPALLEQNNPASLHFYFSNLTHMRKALSPSLMPTYEAWVTNKELSELHTYVKKGTRHWQSLCASILERWNANHDIPADSQVEFIEDNKL